MAVIRRDIAEFARSAGYGRAVLAEDPEWKERALCAQVDHELFFPEKGCSSAAAKKTCGLCPVREECLEYALENHERFGIWGGMSERDRRKLERLREAS